MPTCDRCGGSGLADQPDDPCWPCREASLTEQRDRLDAMPTALYRLYDAGLVPLYIGISHNPDRRLRQHRRTAWWPQVVPEYTHIVWYPTRGHAFAAETAAVLEEMPLHNADCSHPVWLAGRERGRIEAALGLLAEEEKEAWRTCRGERRRRLLAEIEQRRQVLRNQLWTP